MSKIKFDACSEAIRKRDLSVPIKFRKLILKVETRKEFKHRYQQRNIFKYFHERC